MDKLLNSPWFVKIVAVFLSVMLYTTINMDPTTTPSTPSLLPTGGDQQEVIANVPVNVYYDKDKYTVSGIPESANVYIKGPGSDVTKAKLQNEYEIYIDLSEADLGSGRFDLLARGFSSKLDVQIDPVVANVILHEKVNQIMPIEVDFLNKSKITEGYKAEEPIVLPNNVKVSGPKDLVQRISSVKAYVDLKDATETIMKNVPLKVFDNEGNQLELEVEPTVVEVRVPITAPNKTVPISIERKGELPTDLSIKSIEVVPNEVTIFGPLEELEKIELIENLEIDLSKLTSDTSMNIDVPLPDWAVKVNPDKVQVNVSIEEKVEKVLEDIEIKVNGSESTKVTFVSPENGKVDVTILGAKSVLDNITAEDIKVALYTGDYKSGQHKIDLEVSGPQNVEWKLSKSNVTVKIVKNE
ncbi:hypothetical protein BFG57_15115 [Bacillus solimangrovi]|uniref:YbbR-like domain-containing protein YbbR n=1 Tax=Bacillus solimangrovi TaxID=1305675 RepID=A0A1E5LEW0_9BACI|nr:hypothetical protein BFG57_15115 [Bacillus solimangrovi]